MSRFFTATNCAAGMKYLPCGSGSSPTCSAVKSGEYGAQGSAEDEEEADVCVEGCYCPKGTFMQVS